MPGFELAFFMAEPKVNPHREAIYAHLQDWAQARRYQVYRPEPESIILLPPFPIGVPGPDYSALFSRQYQITITMTLTHILLRLRHQAPHHLELAQPECMDQLEAWIIKYLG